MATLHLESSETRPDVVTEHYVNKWVFSQLGRPRNLYRVATGEVWKDHYRVNIYCLEESDRAVRTVTMTDSFFITVGEAGLSSSPPIHKRYE